MRLNSIDVDSSLDSQKIRNILPDEKVKELSLRDSLDKYVSQLKQRTHILKESMQNRSNKHVEQILNDYTNLVKALEQQIIKQDFIMKQIQFSFRDKDNRNQQLQNRIGQMEQERLNEYDYRIKVENENQSLGQQLQQMKSILSDKNQQMEQVRNKELQIVNLESLIKQINQEKNKLNERIKALDNENKQLKSQQKVFTEIQNQTMKEKIKSKDIQKVNKMYRFSQLQLLEKDKQCQEVEKEYQLVNQQNQKQIKLLEECQNVIKKQQSQIYDLKQENLMKQDKVKKLEQEHEIGKRYSQSEQQENNLKYLLENYKNYDEMKQSFQENYQEYLITSNRGSVVEHPIMQRLSQGYQRMSLGVKQGSQESGDIKVEIVDADRIQDYIIDQQQKLNEQYNVDIQQQQGLSDCYIDSVQSQIENVMQKYKIDNIVEIKDQDYQGLKLDEMLEIRNIEKYDQMYEQIRRVDQVQEIDLEELFEFKVGQDVQSVAEMFESKDSSKLKHLYRSSVMVQLNKCDFNKLFRIKNMNLKIDDLNQLLQIRNVNVNRVDKDVGQYLQLKEGDGSQDINEIVRIKVEGLNYVDLKKKKSSLSQVQVQEIREESIESDKNEQDNDSDKRDLNKLIRIKNEDLNGIQIRDLNNILKIKNVQNFDFLQNEVELLNSGTNKVEEPNINEYFEFKDKKQQMKVSDKLKIRDKTMVDKLSKKKVIETIGRIDLNQIFSVKQNTNIKDLNQVFEIKVEPIEISKNVNEYLENKDGEKEIDLNEMVVMKQGVQQTLHVEVQSKTRKLNELDIVYDSSPRKIQQEVYNSILDFKMNPRPMNQMNMTHNSNLVQQDLNVSEDSSRFTDTNQLEDKMNFMDQLMKVKNDMKKVQSELKRFGDGDSDVFDESQIQQLIDQSKHKVVNQRMFQSVQSQVMDPSVLLQNDESINRVSFGDENQMFLVQQASKQIESEVGNQEMMVQDNRLTFGDEEKQMTFGKGQIVIDQEQFKSDLQKQTNQQQQQQQQQDQEQEQEYTLPENIDDDELQQIIQQAKNIDINEFKDNETEQIEHEQENEEESKEDDQQQNNNQQQNDDQQQNNEQINFEVQFQKVKPLRVRFDDLCEENRIQLTSSPTKVRTSIKDLILDIYNDEKGQKLNDNFSFGGEKSKMSNSYRLEETSKRVSQTKVQFNHQNNKQSHDIETHDYLGLQQNEYAKKELYKQGEYIDCMPIFTDYMYRVNYNEKKEKRVILITKKNLYNLHPKKNFKIQRRVPLQKIVKVQISEKCGSLFGIMVKNEYDYLIECFRRNEILMFLIQQFKQNNYKMFQKEFTSNIEIRNRGALYTKKWSDFNTINLNLDCQDGFNNAAKIGYIEQPDNKSLFSYFKSSWTEYFFVLSNIGLLGFLSPQEKKPFCLVPVIGCTLVQNLRDRQKECFKIISSHSEEEFVFRAKSQQEKSSWIQEIVNLQIQGNKRHG